VEAGGTLELVDGEASGATFVLTVPRTRQTS
jgi:hypothetical protein